jgi:hypothetical protein
VALDANGAANGTLSKGNSMMWSDSYDHYSNRGKSNGTLWLQKFGDAVKTGKIPLN